MGLTCQTHDGLGMGREGRGRGGSEGGEVSIEVALIAGGGGVQRVIVSGVDTCDPAPE